MAAARYVQSNQEISDRARKLSLRSAPITNENWTSELSQEWRDFRQDVIEKYGNDMDRQTFLEGDRTNEEQEHYFTYGLQFVLGDLKNGRFDFDRKV